MRAELEAPGVSLRRRAPGLDIKVVVWIGIFRHRRVDTLACWSYQEMRDHEDANFIGSGLEVRAE